VSSEFCEFYYFIFVVPLVYSGLMDNRH
jgi:hypothetical protein